MTQLQPVRGTHDLFGDEARRHQYIFWKSQEVAARYGYNFMATPIFEFTDVFKRTLGETTDIVNKEMYTFTDRGGEEITLRPEGTAGVARAFISEGLAQEIPIKIFYFGPMFRYERPQKGRMRQFHQFGIELIGVPNPQGDVEIISLAHSILEELQIAERTRLEINSIGDSESRKAYRDKLVEYFSRFQSDLSEDSQKRLKINPLRILDSKDPKDQKIVAGAPELVTSLNSTSKEFFDQICLGLKDLGVPFKINPRLVRGLDYYNHSVFEFRTDDLGAQDAVLSGGRYDQLIETMGGPSTPGVGWASGVERLSMLLKTMPELPRPMAIIPLGETAEKAALRIAHDLRRKGFLIEMAYGGNLSKRMKKANKVNAKTAIIIGEDELKRNEATVKDLDTGAQVYMKINELDRLKKP